MCVFFFIYTERYVETPRVSVIKCVLDAESVNKIILKHKRLSRLCSQNNAADTIVKTVFRFSGGWLY